MFWKQTMTEYSSDQEPVTTVSYILKHGTDVKAVVKGGNYHNNPNTQSTDNDPNTFDYNYGEDGNKNQIY